MPQDSGLNGQVTEDERGLKNRVLRLEKMMSQIRKERVLTEQPKTIFVRQQISQQVSNTQNRTQKTEIHE